MASLAHGYWAPSRAVCDNHGEWRILIDQPQSLAQASQLFSPSCPEVAMGPCHTTHVILIMMPMMMVVITHNLSIISPLSDHCPIHTLEAKLGWSDGCQWWSRVGFQHLPENVLRIVKRGGQMCRIRRVAILLSKVFPSSRRCCLLSYYRRPSPLKQLLSSF